MMSGERKCKGLTTDREEVSGALGKCIKQLALNVATNVKFHSSPHKASQFIAKIASEKSEDFNYS